MGRGRALGDGVGASMVKDPPPIEKLSNRWMPGPRLSRNGVLEREKPAGLMLREPCGWVRSIQSSYRGLRTGRLSRMSEAERTQRPTEAVELGQDRGVKGHMSEFATIVLSSILLSWWRSWLGRSALGGSVVSCNSAESDQRPIRGQA